MADQDRGGTVVEEQEPTPPSPNEKDAESRRAAPRRRLRFKLRSPVVFVPLVLVVIAGSILLWRYFSSYESTDDAQVDVHLYPVSARISGYVIKVNVNDN